MIVDFIREYADRREAGGLRWGVEPICQVLRDHGIEIAPSTYDEWRGKLPTKREQRDQAPLVEIRRVHESNYEARKVWLQLTSKASQWPANGSCVARGWRAFGGAR